MKRSLIALATYAALCAGALAQPPVSGGPQQKACIFQVASSRQMYPVYATWQPDDCIDLGRALGAARMSMVCMFDDRVKISAGEWIDVPARDDARFESKHAPSRNCNWLWRRPRAL